MPEIGEVARIVGRLNKHLIGKTIASVQAQDDAIVFKDTSAEEFVEKLQGRIVQAAKQHGKYFWLVMDKPPHPLMHFGMTGWIHLKDDPLSHYRAAENPPQTEWPPKFHKFIFKLQDCENEIAFVDARRLARVRLIDFPDGNDLRAVAPLAQNGPDPVLEPVSLEWLQGKLKARKVPIKAWLLDQSAIAGIGNWVGDEILYHARLHPECYTHNLEESHVADLHKALCFVTKTAVETDADSSKFPKNWLMLHRKGKGKKGGNVNRLPSGEQIEFLTVGGRTSAYICKLQRKVGSVAGEDKKVKGPNKRRRVKQENSDSDEALVKALDGDSNPSKKVDAHGQGKKRTEQSSRHQKEMGAQSKAAFAQQNAPGIKAEAVETSNASEQREDELTASDEKTFEVHGLRPSNRRKA